MSKLLIENLINTGRLSHAYYLEGASDEIALWMASKILCCGSGASCITCSRIFNLNHPDVMFVRQEGLSITVNQIRELHEKAAYKSYDGNGQVFIISNADSMNVQAANAFLKFLEEPKDGVTIIMTGRSKNALLETVRSRVQVIEFSAGQGFMKAAISKGLNFESLGIFEDINISVEKAEEFSNIADSWVDTIKQTLNSTQNRALQEVQGWESLFENKEQRNICVRLIQSYVKSLFANKKGAFHSWGDVPKYEWSELVSWGAATDELTRAFHSNGQFIMHVESFIKKTIKM